jgi:hypothetical protein
LRAAHAERRGVEPVVLTWTISPSVRVVVVGSEAVGGRVLAALARSWARQAEERRHAERMPVASAD